MKASLRIIWILLGLYLIIPQFQLQAQMPQGFKYQTVVRNSSGLAISNESIDFRLSILDGSNQNNVVYVETQTVQSSPMGVVSLMVGAGAAVTGTFNQVNWASGNFYLQIEVKVYGAADYAMMGTSQLVSVPYALYAQSSGAGQWSGDSKSIYYNGWVGINGAVQQDTASTDTILFEVKDKQGKPVFRVLESGVRIYVESGTKGAKGGFSVGGRSAVKGGPADLMWITNDSIRLYVDDPGTKGSKGGFAVGGRTVKGKGEAVNFVHLTPLNYFIGHESGINNTLGEGNTFLGYQAGYSNTEGSTNIFVGRQSGYSNTTGLNNVFLGNTSGFDNIDGYFNVFIGRASGYSNTYGYSNIFIGDGSGGNNTEGESNAYIGDYSGAQNILGTNNVFLGAYAGTSSYGTYNIAIGSHAGGYTTADSNNIFLGYYAGAYNDNGTNNIFIGSESGENNVSGTDNVFIGTNTGNGNDSGHDNIFLGNQAGESNTDGYHNIFLGNLTGNSSSTGDYNNLVGTHSGQYLTTGSLNNFLGDESGYNTTIGSSNLFLGDWSGRDNDDGSENVYLGANAGLLNVSGSGNVFLGFSAGHDESGSNKLYIANSSVDNTGALIYGEFDNKILRFNSDLYIYGTANCTDGIWTSSDIRFKKNILPITNVLDKIDLLKPVTYNWKTEEFKDKGFDNLEQIGLIAQDVEKIFPQLVRTDKSGFKSVDYTKLSAILIQAFKEQQQIINKQQSDLDQAQKSIISLGEENKAIKLQLQKLNDLQSQLNELKLAIDKSSVK